MPYPAPKVVSEPGRSLRWVGAIGSPAFKLGEPIDLVGWGGGGTTLFTLSRGLSAQLREWNLDTGVPRVSKEPTQRWVYGVTAGPAHAIVAPLDFNLWNHVIELWELDRGVVAGRFPRSDFTPRAVAASQDGRLAVVVSRDTVTTYALPACAPGVTVPGRAPVAVSADGSAFVVRSPRGEALRVWGADGRPLGELRARNARTVVAVTFGAGGTVVAALADGSVACWDLATRALRWREQRHEAPVTALGRALDASVFVSVDEEGLARATEADGRLRWSARLGRARPDPSSSDSAARPQVDLSPDGARVAVSRPGAPIAVLDGATGAERSFVEGHARRVSSVAVSADGALVASGGEDGEVRVYDVARARVVRTLKVDRDEVRWVEFPPDRRALRTCGGDGTVRRWNLATGAEESRRDVARGHVLQRTRGALDGSRVLVFFRDHLELWDEGAAEPVVWSAGWDLPIPDGCFAREGEGVLVHWGVAMKGLDDATGGSTGEGRLCWTRLLCLQETRRGPITVLQERDTLTVIEERGERRTREWGGSAIEGKEARVAVDGSSVVVRGLRQLEVWDLRDTPALVGRAELAPGDDTLTALDVSADGAVIAVGTELGGVLVFTADPGR